MQLATEREVPDQDVTPSIRAALIDSLFEAPAPLLAGLIFVSLAAALTALKTGQDLTWACVALLVMTGTFRAVDLRRYQTRKPDLTAADAAHLKTRYQVGAMVQAAAIGTWCSATLLSSDDAVVHMICLSVTTGIVAGGAGRAYGRQWIFQLQVALSFGPTVIALALRGTPYYLAMSVISAAFFMAVVRLSAHLPQIFMRALLPREREAALAGQFHTPLNNRPPGGGNFR